jgi:hypothetical protein
LLQDLQHSGRLGELVSRYHLRTALGALKGAASVSAQPAFGWNYSIRQHTKSSQRRRDSMRRCVTL